MKLSIEEADAVFGSLMEIPKIGVFGLYDLIGLDTIQDILKIFIKKLPKNDKLHDVAKEIPLISNLVNRGFIGKKGKGGFYRINRSGGGPNVLEALNYKTVNYHPVENIDLKIDKPNIKILINRKDKYGEYAWSVISKIIKYASSLVSSNITELNSIDESIRLDLNWTKGPFEILEEIGVANFFNKVDEYDENNFLENLRQTKDENFRRFS